MEFATNSVRNTTLATANDDPYYEVVTRFWHPHVTKINKLDPASRVMTTVCEIDSKGKEAKIRFVDQDKQTDKAEKKVDSSLGEWLSSEAILKLAPEKPCVQPMSYRVTADLNPTPQGRDICRF